MDNPNITLNQARQQGKKWCLVGYQGEDVRHFGYVGTLKEARAYKARLNTAGANSIRILNLISKKVYR